jgi:hypothetical protein
LPIKPEALSPNPSTASPPPRKEKDKKNGSNVVYEYLYPKPMTAQCRIVPGFQYIFVE